MPTALATKIISRFGRQAHARQLRQQCINAVNDQHGSQRIEDLDLAKKILNTKPCFNIWPEDAIDFLRQGGRLGVVNTKHRFIIDRYLPEPTPTEVPRKCDEGAQLLHDRLWNTTPKTGKPKP